MWKPQRTQNSTLSPVPLHLAAARARAPAHPSTSSTFVVELPGRRRSSWAGGEVFYLLYVDKRQVATQACFSCVGVVVASRHRRLLTGCDARATLLKESRWFNLFGGSTQAPRAS